MKNTEQWPQVERLFHQALALAPAERAAFLPAVGRTEA